MNKMRFFFLICLALFCYSGLHALPAKEKDLKADESEEKKIVTASGIVRLVGSSAYSELVITGDNEQWYIAAEDREKLHQLQQQRVTVEGEETVRRLKFANGMSAGIRRELRNIKIISTEQ